VERDEGDRGRGLLGQEILAPPAERGIGNTRGGYSLLSPSFLRGIGGNLGDRGESGGG